MFGSLGGTEILLILVLALIVFGPRKLPEIGRMVGRAVADFRRASMELKTSLEQEVEIDRQREARAQPSAGGDTGAGVAPATVPRGAPIDVAPAPQEATPQARATASAPPPDPAEPDATRSTKP